MIDQRMVQGLLIAAVCFLIFAIATTWGDIKRYDRVGTVPAAAPQPAPSAPAPSEPPAEEAAEVLGVLYVDVPSVLASPMVQKAAAQQGGVPDEVKGVGQITAYLLPPATPGGEPRGYGIVELSGAALQQVQAAGASAAVTKTIGGLQAFQGPAGGPMPMGGEEPPWMALTSDDSLIIASTEEMLARGIDAYTTQSLPGPGGAPFELAQAFGDAAVRGGMAVSSDMLQQMPMPPGAPFMADIRGLAFGVTIGADAQVGALMRFGAASGAQAAADAITAGIASQKEKLTAQAQDPAAAAMMAPLTDLMDKVQVSASGADCRIDLTLTEQDFQALGQVVGMMVMGAMMGGQGGAAVPMPMP